MARKSDTKTSSRTSRGATVKGGKPAARATDLEMQRVSQEIARLVEASRQGQLEERGRVD